MKTHSLIRAWVGHMRNIMKYYVCALLKCLSVETDTCYECVLHIQPTCDSSSSSPKNATESDFRNDLFFVILNICFYHVALIMWDLSQYWTIPQSVFGILFSRKLYTSHVYRTQCAWIARYMVLYGFGRENLLVFYHEATIIYVVRSKPALFFALYFGKPPTRRRRKCRDNHRAAPRRLFTYTALRNYCDPI